MLPFIACPSDFSWLFSDQLDEVGYLFSYGTSQMQITVGKLKDSSSLLPLTLSSNTQFSKI
jgi:hypothetical protein